MDADLLAWNIAAHWLQAGLLAGAVLLAIRAVRPASPRARLAALHLTLVATLLLPAIQPWHADDSGSTRPVTVDLTGGARPDAPHPAASRAPALDPSRILLVVIVAGTVLRFVWVLAGILRLARLRNEAVEIPPPDVARDVESALGVTARYFEHRGQTSPATFGIFGAAILLPLRFASLDLSMQRAIVCHELLHAKRRDTAVTLVEEAILSLLWFHPGAWFVRSQIRIEREHIVDALAVRYLGDRAGYVRCLVAMSGHDLVPRLSAGMFGERKLRARIDAVLEEVPMSRSDLAFRIVALMGAAAGAVWLGSWAAPLRAQTPPGGGPAAVYHVSVPMERLRAPSLRQGSTGQALRRAIRMPALEYPQDALEAGIGGRVFVDIAVNAAGDVTTGAIVTGPDELRDSAFKAAMALKFNPHPETTPMRLSVDYRIRSDSTTVSISWWDASGTRTRAAGRRLPSDRGATAVVWEQNSERRDVAPPRKTKDVAPTYPAAARAAGVQGSIVLEAIIDERGRVTRTSLLRSIPLLDRAAIDAVMQWEYEPTMINGTAVPNAVTVTVNFVTRDAPGVP
jgi:TonB family protein